MSDRAQVGIAHRAAHLDRAPSPDGDAVELERGSRLVRCPGQIGGHAIEGDHVAQVLLAGVEDPVLVEVLRVGPAVPPGTHAPRIPDAVDAAALGQAVLRPHTERVGRVVPQLTAGGIRFLVQDRKAPRPTVRSSPCRVPRPVHEERVLADRPEIDHQRHVLSRGDVDLEELGAGQVEALGGQRRGEGSPADRATRARRAQTQEHARLSLLGPRDPDLSIDLLSGEEAFVDAQAVSGRALHDPLRLPGHGGRGAGVERGRQESLGPVQEGGRAPELPIRGHQRDRERLGRVEVVDERSSAGVGVGHRERQLALDVQRRPPFEA